MPGYEQPKRSNRLTVEAAARRPVRWDPVIDFFKALPIGLALPDLRIIHACWYEPSLAQVERLLGLPVRPAGPGDDAVATLERHVVLRSPFDISVHASRTRLLPGLPGDTKDREAVIPHEDLMKGHEVPAAEPFEDFDRKIQTKIRELWWRDGLATVCRDRPQVFGHYWNLPPSVGGQMTPPEPPGHPKLREWAAARALGVPPAGRHPMIGDVVCVDFQGVTKATDHACIGALRWPEREIAWAWAGKTSEEG